MNIFEIFIAQIILFILLIFFFFINFHELFEFRWYFETHFHFYGIFEKKKFQGKIESIFQMISYPLRILTLHFRSQGVNSALTTYFFGKKMDKKLTIEKFLEFQQQIQREILSLEFKRKNPTDDGKISESDFAELLLAYAGLSDKKKWWILFSS